MEITFKLVNNIDILILIFIRIIGMFVAAPIFRQRSIPTYTKIGLAFIIAVIIFPVIDVSTKVDNRDFFILFLNVIKESLTGIMMGYMCYIYYTAIYLAGYLIDMQIGFSMATVLNPQDEAQIPLMGNFFYIIATLVFLSINGHHTLIYALKYSFNSVPIGSVGINITIIELLINILSSTFIIAIKMAGPIIVSIFVTNVALGILARTMPQMNIFMVGMPLKVLVGLAILILTGSLYVGVYEHIFGKMFDSLYYFMNVLTKG
ncbi:flagellar type III secretion system protein FliR [Lutibacter sp. B2]|nr:flagellar type III secretion system protein FliR [Lutibacter sp. B2]